MERINQIAVVTGASSGIGKAITIVLLEKGYRVYGIGRDFSHCDIDEKDFIPCVIDVKDTNGLRKLLDRIPYHDVSVVVNNAGIAYYGMHEEQKWESIQDMVRVNLEVPMLISNYFMRALRETKGYLINIESVTAMHASPHGAAYGATKAGLLSFTDSVWEENRKYGVKVVSILPDMTSTNLYRHADFETSEEQGSFLSVEDVSNVVRNILDQSQNIGMTQIVLKPQFHRIKRKKNR